MVDSTRSAQIEVDDVGSSVWSPLCENALREIERHSRRAGGQVGVAAWRLLGKGPKLLFNADDFFPMASTFKVAVACRVMELVEAGGLSLGDLIEITDEIRVASSVISERFPHSGIHLSVHNLLQVMLDESDNTATDLLTQAAGGPDAITEALRRWGIADQRVDRDTRGLIRDFYDLGEGPFMPALLKAREQADFASRVRLPNLRFEDDPRDTSTPRAMSILLTKLISAQIVTASSAGVLSEIMKACRTSNTRIRGMLPAGVTVVDKTGTIGGVVNDVGMIILPGDTDSVILSIFIKKSDVPFEDRERAIAEIARTVYDFFLLISDA